MKYINGTVFLSYAISFLGSYLTISLCEQLRLQCLRANGSTDELTPKLQWFALMGVSLGGVGIWCMHFIGMAAMTLENEKGEHVPFYFNIPITIASLVVSVVMTGVGLFILSKDRLFAKSKSEILDMFISDLRHLSIGELRKVKNLTMMKLITTKAMGYLVVGGMVTGAGVSVMHYVGMRAVEFDGEIEWNGGIILASICIAIVAATAAFWILFRLLSIFPGLEYLRLLSSMTMAAAVCGMHYTGMEAAKFKVNDSAPNYHDPYADNPYYVSNSDVEIPVLLCAMFVLWSMVIIILSDLRNNVQKYQLLMKKRRISVQSLYAESDRSPASSLSSHQSSFPMFHQLRGRSKPHAKICPTLSSSAANTEDTVSRQRSVQVEMTSTERFV